jgi:hypothetical protein
MTASHIPFRLGCNQLFEDGFGLAAAAALAAADEARGK